MQVGITDILTIIGLVLTFTAFLIGIIQYRQTQRWKALEFVSTEVKEFLANRDVQNALLMLDWNGRPITFLVQQDGKELLETITVTDEMVLMALRSPKERQDTPLTKRDGLIRDTFNILFDYLCRFNTYTEASGLLTYQDIQPFLGYWLEILSSGRGKPARYASSVKAYLSSYRYIPVIQLLQKHHMWIQKHPEHK